MQEALFQEAPTQEAMEMELASELLEVTNEQELDRFLGRLIKRVGSAVGRVVRSPIGRALGGILRPLAKAALPIAGTALGTFVGGPLGGAVGGKLASAAGNLFGLELEGLSAEDREFEVARRFVRFAGSACKHALAASPTANPQAVARAAVATAAGKTAPGLAPGGALATLNGSGPADSVPVGGGRRGVWVRRGRRILLVGV